MRYKIDRNSTLWIADQAAEKLRAHRQLSESATEACGVLIGHGFVEHSDIVIIDVTEPQPHDVRSRCQVYRSQDHSNIVVDRWCRSGKTETYVGLWHTHAEPFPTPSVIDLKDWENALIKDKYDGPRLFFAIVGTESVSVWMGQKSRLNIRLGPTIAFRKLKPL